METYLKAAGDSYLVPDGGTVRASEKQAGYNGLLIIEAFDPVKRAPASDPTIKSQGLVTMRNREGVLLVPEAGVLGGFDLSVSKAGGSTMPQIGQNVFRIYKVGGQKDEPINYGDTVVIRFTPPEDNAPALWMSNTGAFTPVSFITREVPTEAEYFQLFPQVDLIDLEAQYDDILNAVALKLMLSGSALPGGHLIRVESPDAPDLIPPSEAVIDENPTSFALELDEGKRYSPCAPRMLTISATMIATGATYSEQVKLTGDRAHFLAMKVEGAKKNKAMIGAASVDITASLRLDQSAKRLDPRNIPMKVDLYTESPEIKNLEQQGTQVDWEQGVVFTFTVTPPGDGAAPVCALIKGEYILDGKLRESNFVAKISAKGIALDPNP